MSSPPSAPRFPPFGMLLAARPPYATFPSTLPFPPRTLPLFRASPLFIDLLCIDSFSSPSSHLAYLPPPFPFRSVCPQYPLTIPADVVIVIRGEWSGRIVRGGDGGRREEEGLTADRTLSTILTAHKRRSSGRFFLYATAARPKRAAPIPSLISADFGILSKIGSTSSRISSIYVDGCAMPNQWGSGARGMGVQVAKSFAAERK
ncbi:hypothetical protein DFH06DRAFT_1424312 [Mycena polygramma]|nr:hypothetical protein DFH06DRAFT_1424312 [Mycena polygramma]